MFDITLIMLGAGNSTRMQIPTRKQWLYIDNEPLWLYATKNLSRFYTFKEIIIVSNEGNYMSCFAPNYTYVKGGNTRQESLKNALSHVKSEYVLVSDIARANIPHELLHKIIQNSDKADCIVPVLNVVDTTYYQNETVEREKIKLIQTPQLSRTKILSKALQSDTLYTDDSSAIRAVGGSIWQIQGDERARKITTHDDLFKIPLLPPSKEQFVGTGFDVHEFANGYELWLCGEKIEHEKGLKAHSDGDVALHALTDAILGAAGLGDIGEHFPDSDPSYKGANSLTLLKTAYEKVRSVGFELVNADITIMAEQPKLSKFKAKMQTNIATALNVMPNRINVKATTTEKLGFVGRGEGIAVIATAGIKYYDWTKK